MEISEASAWGYLEWWLWSVNLQDGSNYTNIVCNAHETVLVPDREDNVEEFFINLWPTVNEYNMFVPKLSQWNVTWKNKYSILSSHENFTFKNLW